MYVASNNANNLTLVHISILNVNFARTNTFFVFAYKIPHSQSDFLGAYIKPKITTTIAVGVY
jgi:hypothetical protein